MDRAEDIMVTEVAFVKATDTVGYALEVLAALHVRHLPVLDGGDLVGMVSDRDLRDLGLYQSADAEDDLGRLRDLLDMPLSEVMSGDVQTVEASASVREVIDLMVGEKIGAVPVVEGDTRALVGIVSYVDVLRASAERFEE